MKILLTHTYFISEDPKEQLIMKPYVPLGILYLSGYLEKHNFEHEVFDSTFSSFENQIGFVKNYKPDLIAIYVNLMTKLNVLKLIKILKTDPELNHIKIILGGPEIRNHAENFLLYGADILVVGEGEETMLGICKNFLENKIIPLNVSGTILMYEGKLKINLERALIKNIDELTFPNRKKINLHQYLETWKKHHGSSTVSISTMRGCPYTCKWCSRAVYGGTYRRRSASLVVEEMMEIKKNYNPDMLWFVDDVFTISHKWLDQFAIELKKQNLIFPFEIITRADRLNEEVLKLLKEIGCRRIWIGAESGSQKIIDAMDRRVDVQKVRDMILLAKKCGIEAGTFIMLGYPGETYQDIKETILHLIISKPDYYTITIAYPIKGTSLYNEIESKITTTLNWSETTDRQIDFKRTYTKKYYEYAVRWVYNEVKLANEKKFLSKLKLKTKAILSQSMMFYSR